MAFPLVIWERTRTLLLSGYRPDEIETILEVEFASYLDEFHLEDLPKLVKSAHRQFEIIQSRKTGEQREDIRQQSVTVAPAQPKQSDDHSAEKPGTSG